MSPPFFVYISMVISLYTVIHLLIYFIFAYLSIHLEPIGIMFNLKYCSKL